MEQPPITSKSENAEQVVGTSASFRQRQPRVPKGSKHISRNDAILILQGAINALQNAELRVEAYPCETPLTGCMIWLPGVEVTEKGEFVPK